MKKAIKAIMCDFDGTFSTLRCGWEGVMKKMMLKYLTAEERRFPDGLLRRGRHISLWTGGFDGGGPSPSFLMRDICPDMANRV